MKNALHLPFVKIITLVLGYLGSLSFVRSVTSPFHWSASSFYNYSFDFGRGTYAL